MNYKLMLRLLGAVLQYEGLFMLPALAVSLWYRGSDVYAFLGSIALLLAVGVPLNRIRTDRRPMQTREGFSAVAIIWLVMSVFGALPFLLSGAIPRFADAVFESAAGFTTTGGSVLTDVEALPRGILFWRSFTNWVGGMGVLVFALALMPTLGSGSVNLLRAESPGPMPGKLLPKLGETAKALYIIYSAMTALLVCALALAGMPLFDAVIHALATAGTGGFSNRALSVGAYGNPAVEWILVMGMLLFGVNFTVYFHLIRRNLRLALKNEELWWYGAAALAASAVIFFQIVPIYRGFGDAARRAVFQVASIITTTGFNTADYGKWPELSRVLLLFLMVTGACAGSTSGGIKVIRVALLAKAVRRAMGRMIHPRMMQSIKLEGKPVHDDLPQGALAFLAAYIAVAALGLLAVSLDNFDLATSFSAVLSCVSNIGPGFGRIGPMGNFAPFSEASKLVLSVIMIAGRLEIFPVMLLFSRRMWKNT